MEEFQGLSLHSTIMLCGFIMSVLVVFVVVIAVLSQRRVKNKQTELQLEQFQHHQELYEAVNQVGQKEREKLAINVHDDLGILLNNINQNLNKINRNMDDKKKVQELVNLSKEILEHAIETTRNIALEIMPKTLIRLGYPNALAEMCRYRNASEDVRIIFDLTLVDFRVEAHIEFQLYRITKEVITNIIKHSHASEIMIVIDVHKNITITISHNGIGISNEKVSQLSMSGKGYGLKSIESRIQQIEATLQYIVVKRNLSKIIIEIPGNNLLEPEKEKKYDN